MKTSLKVFIAVFAVPVVLMLLMGAAPLTSTVTDTTARLDGGNNITTISWVADSTGAVTATLSTAFIRGIIKQFITKPDTSRLPATADSSGRYPTADYDITLTNTLGIDVAGGALSNRATSTVERALPWLLTPAVSGDADTIPMPFINNSKITTAVTNNLIPNARGHIYIYWSDK